METLTLENGAFEAPAIEHHVPTETAQASGGVALSEECPSPPESPRRHGYREDSPPEVLSLLLQAQAGDTEAFGELYRTHLTRVTWYVSARMRDENRDAIPDVVQDAFCEAFADLAGAHHDVKGWLLAHAAKAYIRYARSDRQQGRAITSAREHERRAYTYGHGRERQPEGTITSIGRVMLVQALARLTPDQRRCIQHRYLEGQMQTTTAGLMGKTLRAVKSAEYRAIVKLRAELA